MENCHHSFHFSHLRFVNASVHEKKTPFPVNASNNMLLTLCYQTPVCRILLTPNRSTGLWQLYRTWVTHTHTHTRLEPHHIVNWSLFMKAFMCKHHSLLASPVPFTARQRHFNHTGGEGDPQGVTPAVHLHADDALVLHAVDAAPRRRRRGHETWVTPTFLHCPAV